MQEIICYIRCRVSAPVTIVPQYQDAPMYEEYYGFVRSPFTLAPDPRFLYLSGCHHDALHQLLQSIRRKEGFIVLTGDIGTGKTTVCRAVIDQLDRTTFTSLILNPFLSAEDLLREVLLDFGIVSREAVRSGRLAHATTHELVTTLHEFLLSLVPIGGSAVLVIDEAQHLPAAVLEQIRIISNLETSEARLLQVVLVGQLNLLDVLAGADMRQLDQRISLRAILRPLTRDEVDAYIAHRMGVARSERPVSFDPAAVERVHLLTGGIPRVINLICDRTLMLGADRQLTAITRELVQEAAVGLGLGRRDGVVAQWWRDVMTPAWKRVPKWIPATAALLLFAIGVVLGMPLHRLLDTSPPSLPPRSPVPVQVPLQPGTMPPGDMVPIGQNASPPAGLEDTASPLRSLRLQVLPESLGRGA
jgi:general secretion pathway protein A